MSIKPNYYLNPLLDSTVAILISEYVLVFPFDPGADFVQWWQKLDVPGVQDGSTHYETLHHWAGRNVFVAMRIHFHIDYVFNFLVGLFLGLFLFAAFTSFLLRFVSWFCDCFRRLHQSLWLAWTSILSSLDASNSLASGGSLLGFTWRSWGGLFRLIDLLLLAWIFLNKPLFATSALVRSLSFSLGSFIFFFGTWVITSCTHVIFGSIFQLWTLIFAGTCFFIIFVKWIQIIIVGRFT